jgi:hypothetical protein
VPDYTAGVDVAQCREQDALLLAMTLDTVDATAPPVPAAALFTDQAVALRFYGKGSGPPLDPATLVNTHLLLSMNFASAVIFNALVPRLLSSGVCTLEGVLRALERDESTLHEATLAEWRAAEAADDAARA